MNGNIVFNEVNQETRYWENIPDGSVVQSDTDPKLVLFKVSEYGLRLRTVGGINAGTLQCPGPHSTWLVCNYKLEVDLVY